MQWSRIPSAMWIFLFLLIVSSIVGSATQKKGETWGMIMFESLPGVESTMKENITLFGRNLSQDNLFLSRSSLCEFITAKLKPFPPTNNHSIVAEIDLQIESEEWDLPMFACSNRLETASPDAIVIVQSSNFYKLLVLYIIIYAVCTLGSCLFTALNVSVISLDVEMLELIRDHDPDPKNRIYASNLLPLRRNANFAFTTIILGNTLCNTAAAIVFDVMIGNVEFPSPWLHTVLVSIVPAIVILIMGEIFPQILCTKKTLYIGSLLRYLMVFFMVLTFSISYPLALLLDLIVGKETRPSSSMATIDYFAIKEKNLAVELAKNALVTENVVKSAMTPIEKVTLIDESTVFNMALLKKLKKESHTRIPVYKGPDKQVCGILNIKDLMLINHTWDLKLSTIMQLWYRSHLLLYVHQSTLLVDLLADLQKRLPLALVFSYDNHRRRQMIVGIVTLEDNLEEFVGEIQDEREKKTQGSNANKSSSIKRNDTEGKSKSGKNTRSRAGSEFALPIEMERLV